MYENEPVLIPVIPGKITVMKKKGSEYIRYLIGKRYDPLQRFNIPERKIIGIRIPSIQEMMLPNENYHLYFSGDGNMNEKQKSTAQSYASDKKRFIMLRELFDQMYYEFQLQSRRKPDEPVNAYKVKKINSILAPLKEMMAGEDYATYLDIVSEAEGDGTDTSDGKTYSDVALLLTQYKGSMKRFFSERM